MDGPMASLELLLDAAAEARIRDEWQALGDAGFSSMAAHTAASNRPHVTLLAQRVLRAAPRLPQGAPRLPLPLVLGEPLLLGAGARRVLARAVVPSEPLLALQRALAAADQPAHEHFLPGRWMPHVTLARRLRLADLPAALELLGGPIEARAVALRHWDPETATITPLPA